MRPATVDTLSQNNKHKREEGNVGVISMVCISAEERASDADAKRRCAEKVQHKHTVVLLSLLYCIYGSV